jgi:hypothetical protein
MKKIILMIAALCAALAVVGCASSPSSPPASEMMASARRNAPEGTVVGQATGSDASKADSDAKYQITRAISFMVKDMVEEAVAADVVEYTPAEAFRQGVNTALTRISMSAAVRQDSGMGSGKVYWAVYYMDKSEVVKVINQAVAASKAVNPDAAAFSIEDRIDKAYSTHAAREWKN